VEAVADPGFAKGGGGTMAVRTSLNRGLGAEPPAGYRGRAPGGAPGGGSGGKAPLKLKGFCTFLYKKWPKVKDLQVKICPRV